MWSFELQGVFTTSDVHVGAVGADDFVLFTWYLVSVNPWPTHLPHLCGPIVRHIIVTTMKTKSLTKLSVVVVKRLIARGILYCTA